MTLEICPNQHTFEANTFLGCTILAEFPVLLFCILEFFLYLLKYDAPYKHCVGIIFMYVVYYQLHLFSP
jgi:hypothetical protein